MASTDFFLEYDGSESRFSDLDALMTYVQVAPDGSFHVDTRKGAVTYFYCSFNNTKSHRSGCNCRRTLTCLSSNRFTLVERQLHRHFGRQFPSGKPTPASPAPMAPPISPSSVVAVSSPQLPAAPAILWSPLSTSAESAALENALLADETLGILSCFS